MSEIDRLRELIDPNRDGGVSHFELDKAVILADEVDAELAALRARCETLEAALKHIVDTSDSDAASGGEMWYAAAVCPAIEAARALLTPPVTPRPETVMPELTPYQVLQIERSRKDKPDERDGKT